MCSDTLEFQSKNERDGGSSSKNEPRKSRIGTKEIKADFKKSRTDVSHPPHPHHSPRLFFSLLICVL